MHTLFCVWTQRQAGEKKQKVSFIKVSWNPQNLNAGSKSQETKQGQRVQEREIEKKINRANQKKQEHRERTGSNTRPGEQTQEC